MKRLIYILLSFLTACSNDWHNPSLSPDRRADLLLAEMTLEEKVGQLQSPYGWEFFERQGDSVFLTEAFMQAVNNRHIGMAWGTFRADPWTEKNLTTGLSPRLAARLANMMQRYVVENTRLGIPLFLAEEGSHGHMAIGTTTFPTALGQASTWNPELIREMGKVIGREMRQQGAHICYGPILDIVRDPRWSRVEESYGEDRWLTARMGEAFVQGLGSTDLSRPFSALSTLKHFVAYGVSEAGQNGGAVQVGERELREHFLPPFHAAINAGARSVMTAYNSVDGVPCTANRRLLTDLLRGEWQFDGFVISDLLSIEGLCDTHNVVASKEQAAMLALLSGVDVDLKGDAFDLLQKAVKEKKISEHEVDRAVKRVLKLKFEMGLFENPYVDEELTAEVCSDEASQLALQIAQQSIILLENRKSILPLDPSSLARVALIGPNADNIYHQLGDYTAQQTSFNTVRDGLERVLGKNRVEYVKGCSVRDSGREGIADAVEAARRTDVTIVVVGGSSARDFDTEFLRTGAAKVSEKRVNDMECGEGNDRATLHLMGVQLELLKAIRAVGKPMVVVYIEGRPLDMTWSAENADALLLAWYPGARGGDAIADVLTGTTNPAGRLPISIPRAEGQIPVYYNKRQPVNHDYIDLAASPLYPFGHGLSYARFEYGNLDAERSGNERIKISCSVQNISQCAGDAVVQLYFIDKVASTVRPVKQLGGFKRIHLKPDEIQTVEFTLGAEALTLIDENNRPCIEKGLYEIQIGNSSQDIKLCKTITL